MMMQDIADIVWIDGAVELVLTNDWLFFETILVDGWSLIRFLSYFLLILLLGGVAWSLLRRRRARRLVAPATAALLITLCTVSFIKDFYILPPMPPSADPPVVDAATAAWLATDAITVTPATADERRRALATAIWGEADLRILSAERVAEVDMTADREFHPFRPVAARAVEIARPVRLGFTAVAHRLDPHEPNGVGVLYHQGHHPHGALIGGRRIIASLLESGYTIVALSMPGSGRMVEPETIPTASGPKRLTREHGAVTLHNALGHISTNDGSGLDFFLTASAMAVDHLIGHLGADAPLAMMGLSGGGWTTTVYAAMDARIQLAVEVAGSQPLFLDEFNGFSGGDYETFHPALTQNANFLELYTLAGAGEGRQFIQILNEFDPCCFFSRAAKIYEPTVAEQISRFDGGGYRLFVLRDRWHRIGPEAMTIVKTALSELIE